MVDSNLIGTNVKAGMDFNSASSNRPVLNIHVKPDIIPKIISSLSDLKGRTDDSEIMQSGSKYSFIDKRTNQPLAELDAAAGILAIINHPKIWRRGLIVPLYLRMRFLNLLKTAK